MPDPTDFLQIARRIAERTSSEGIALPATVRDTLTHDIAQQLRHVWNVRGGLDIATVETVLSTLVDATTAEAYLTALDRALRHLDR
jgi:hypothetical protein